jgi:hypothetical protein
VAKFIGLAVDPVPGGSTLDTLGATPAFETPSIYLPVESATVSQGYRNQDRSNEVRGVRGSVAPIAFQADPTATFRVRAYPEIAQFLWPKALGGAITTTGVSPAPVVSSVGVAESVLPALQLLVVRGEQTDRLTGAWVDTVELGVTEDGDPTFDITVRGLFHKHYVTASPPTPTYTDSTPYSTVTLKTLIGATSTVIPCVASLTLTYDNQLKDETKLRFCKGENIEIVTQNGRYLRRQYPGKNKLGDQQVTGTVEFSDVRVDIEDRLRIAQADKLVFELSGDPIAPTTTPPADDLMRITIPSAVFTGGGAGELNDDADPDSSYEFGGFLDPGTNESFGVEFVSADAVA